MRALCLTNIGQPAPLAVLEVPQPRLERPDQVRIGVRAVALNHLDLFVAAGLPAVPIANFPFPVASDAAGVVLEIGSAVAHLQVGDRVVVNPAISCGECPACQGGEEVFCRHLQLLGEHRPGTAAEELVLPAKNVLPIHGEWSWAEAAAFSLSTLTAWRMLTTRAKLQADEGVLIWGIGGGVAQAAMAIAQHLGARVVVTSSSQTKRDRALALGAQAAWNHAADDVPAQVKATWGHGADLVVDSVGAPTWERSLKALRPGGRLVTCGATADPQVALDIRRLFWFQWSLLGSTMGTSREFAEVVALGNAGHLRPVIDSIFPLADASSAYRHMADGKQFGKIVLEVTP